MPTPTSCRHGSSDHLPATTYNESSGRTSYIKGDSMYVQELIGRKVWIKSGDFRSVPGQIESVSNAVVLDDGQSSVAQSTFLIEMTSGEVCEVLGSDILKIEDSKTAPSTAA